MVEEAVLDAHDAMQAVRLWACDLINIKLMKCGGLLAALALDAVAETASSTSIPEARPSSMRVHGSLSKMPTRIVAFCTPSNVPLGSRGKVQLADTRTRKEEETKIPPPRESVTVHV